MDLFDKLSHEENLKMIADKEHKEDSMKEQVAEIADRMIVDIANTLMDGEKVFIGLNSHIPLLASALAKVVHKKKLTIFSAADSHNPAVEKIRLKQSTGDPAFALTGTVLRLVDEFDLMQKGMIDTVFLGPIQVDAQTNFNISVIGSYEEPRIRFPGGALSASAAPLVKRLVLLNTKHSKKVLVEKVDFITATAKHSTNEVWLFTNLCTFTYNRAIAKWTLHTIHPWATIDQVRQNTDFDFEVGEVKISKEPSSEEKSLISLLDPQDLRLKIF